MTESIYRASPGFRISNRDAAVLGEAFEQLERDLGHSVSPEELAEAAKADDSPFHAYFEWDTAKQVQFYLVARATYIIRALDVVLPDHGDVPVRGIIPVLDGTGTYMSTNLAARKRPDVIKAQIARAQQDAKLIVERYQGWIAFKEFAPATEFVQAAVNLANATGQAHEPTE